MNCKIRYQIIKLFHFLSDLTRNYRAQKQNIFGDRKVSISNKKNS